MPLVTCRECGHKVSSEANSCPSCGAPSPKRSGISRPVLVLGIIALVMLLIIAVSQQNSSSPGKPAVKAQAALTRSAVVITNLDDFTWPGVTLYLNGTPLDGYKVVYDQEVPPHQEISVPLTEFVHGDRRFNPFERKPTQIMIWVQGHDAPILSFR